MKQVYFKIDLGIGVKEDDGKKVSLQSKYKAKNKRKGTQDMKKVITFGEVMVRLATPRHKRFVQSDDMTVTFGGGELNVAISLANYGAETQFVTRLPKNEIAQACVGTIRTKYVGVDHIVYSSEKDRIGVYYLETGAAMRPSKVIYDRANSAFCQIEPGMVDWNKIFEDAGWFHFSGITPALGESAAEACMEAVTAAYRHGLTVSCDINNRFSLWKWGKSVKEVMPEFMDYCDVVLASKEDLSYIFGIEPREEDIRASRHTDNLDLAIYESSARQFMDRYPRVRKMVTTFRDSINASHNKLKACIYDGDEMFRGPKYDIPDIIDRVGGGDAFMGGVIYGLMNYNDQQAINFAETASFLKHTIYGDFNRVTKEEILRVMKGGKQQGITYQ